MRDPSVEALRRRLASRRADIMARYGQFLPLVDTEALGPWDPQFLSTLADADLRSLADIEHALFLVEDGSYGRCVVCKRPIEPERLALVPESPRCRDCASPHGNRMAPGTLTHGRDR